MLDQSIAQGELRVDWRETHIESGLKDQPPITITETSRQARRQPAAWRGSIHGEPVSIRIS